MYLLTKSEVFTGKSQTRTLLLLLLGQNGKVKVWDFPVRPNNQSQ